MLDWYQSYPNIGCMNISVKMKLMVIIGGYYLTTEWLMGSKSKNENEKFFSLVLNRWKLC